LPVPVVNIDVASGNHGQSPFNAGKLVRIVWQCCSIYYGTSCWCQWKASRLYLL